MNEVDRQDVIFAARRAHNTFFDLVFNPMVLREAEIDEPTTEHKTLAAVIRVTSIRNAAHRGAPIWNLVGLLGKFDEPPVLELRAAWLKFIEALPYAAISMDRYFREEAETWSKIERAKIQKDAEESANGLLHLLADIEGKIKSLEVAVIRPSKTTENASQGDCSPRLPRGFHSRVYTTAELKRRIAGMPKSDSQARRKLRGREGIMRNPDGNGWHVRKGLVEELGLPS